MTAVAPMQILEALAKWTTAQPDKTIWNFLDDHAKISDSFTYKELDRASSSLAAYLLYSCNIKAGDRVLLVFIPGLQYAVSLIACFKASIIAVPVFPPDPRKLEKDIHHFISITSSSGAKVALTHSAYNFNRKLAGIKSIFASQGSKTWPELQWIEVDDVLTRARKTTKKDGPSLPPGPSAQDIAFLQYTSGSTSEPKGVMISHANLAHNETIIIKEVQANPSTICVSWLPQYHDMGLIGSYLGTLYCGGTGYYLSPLSFLKDPVLWLHAMSLYKGTHTQAPNFAYALVTRKFKEALAADPSYATKELRLDLSSIVNMLNAAEPVDDVAINSFYFTFAPFGLKQSVVIPTYGLAEHTVFVCSRGKTVLKVSKADFEHNTITVLGQSILGGDAVEKCDTATHMVVGCGFPTMDNDIELLIVNEEHIALSEGQIGEVWVKSPSKAQGYWSLPELTAEDFHALPRSPDSSARANENNTGYLRTGDLGFMHNGELFICGRSKDLIIVRGTNHYPQDIEKTVETTVTELRPGCSAAFALKNDSTGTEKVVYVAEVLLPCMIPSLVLSCRSLVDKRGNCSIRLRWDDRPHPAGGVAEAWHCAGLRVSPRDSLSA